jgi:hypothetical protein
MRSLTCQKGFALTGLLVAALMAVAPTVAGARPRPGKPTSGFHLFARSLAAITGNRVYCGLNASKGQVCVDSTGATVAGGGFWPKGTIGQYVFGSGIEVAGIIGDEANPEWRGKISGGFFEDPKGTTENGRGVQPIYNSNDPTDVASWPKAAFVPSPPDPQADIFATALQGQLKASSNDVWWVTWEGDPSANAGRDHPLGIAVETRGLAFTTPAGNEDILYFIYTLYNITSANRADYEAHSIRKDMVDILEGLGKQFQSLNNAKFGISIPSGGYSIKNMFVTFAADMDVGEAGQNFASVNVPFSLGFAYQHNFAQPSGYTFDPGIFGAPFFPGVGFVGVKYLRSPNAVDPVTGQPIIDPVTGLPKQVGLTLYSNTSRTTAFQDPNDVFQLYRYSTGNIDPGLGDDTCNVGDVSVTHICFINGYKGSGAPTDMRFFQSSGPLTLPPGGSGSVVVAYVFAAPVKTGACPAPACASVLPGDPTKLSSATALTSTGANIIDSITGFKGFVDDNADGVVQQNEIRTVPQSLLGKALIAQTVFDSKFLQPAAPQAPEFILVPSDHQVTVLWQPSTTESPTGGGDPYFQAASANPLLFDPNYRQFDVEGYRVYRGRTDSPNTLVLLQQFDSDTTHFIDRTGQVNTVEGDQTSSCAPALGIFVGTAGHPCVDAGIVNGVHEIVPDTFPIATPLVQVPEANYKPLASGKAFVAASDTAVSGSAAAAALGVIDRSKLTLGDTKIPFVFVDKDVQNNVRYFYSVTAFDVNSIRSGPSSLESARITKPVTPQRQASNYTPSTLVSGLVGRDPATLLDPTKPLPSIASKTGIFSGPFPPANAWDFGFLAFVKELVSTTGSFSLQLDSIQLGSAADGVPATYWYTATTPGGTSVVSLPILQDFTTAPATAASALFDVQPLDQSLANRFGAKDQAFLPLRGQVKITLPGNYFTNDWGRGAAGLDIGSFSIRNSFYNGARWFDGPSPQKNETKADPAEGNCFDAATSNCTTDNFNNAGRLTGVSVIHEPHGYITMSGDGREFDGGFGAAVRAADFNVYWGDNGAVDSVIDITHNVVVPFSDHFGGTWGFLNQSATTVAGSPDAQPGLLTIADAACVGPFRTIALPLGVQGTIGSNDRDAFECTTPSDYLLSNQAVLGPIGFFTTDFAAAAAAPPAPEPGMLFYLPGHLFAMQLPALPTKGTVWSMRSYIGTVMGGKGFKKDGSLGSGGDQGPYSFLPQPRTMSAVGATFSANYSTGTLLAVATKNDLTKVHTVPDPYYITNSFETTTENKVIKFVNLPNDCIIRIYSLSGVLIRVLEHHATDFGGDETWDVRNRSSQFVASGVYFYHVEAGGARRVGRIAVVNFAQ